MIPIGSSLWVLGQTRVWRGKAGVLCWGGHGARVAGAENGRRAEGRDGEGRGRVG